MLLRVGVVAMIFSVALAAGVAVMVAFRDEPAPQAVSMEPAEALASTPAPEPEPRAEPLLSIPVPRPRPEPGSKPEPDPRPTPKPGKRPEPRPQPEPRPAPKPERELGIEPGPGPQALDDRGWPALKKNEQDLISQPRRFDLPPGAIMGLTIDSIGLHNGPVISSNSPRALHRGVVHIPQTSLPWSPTPQRNVYIAGHRLGYPGTGSRLIFYELDELSSGDEVILRDHRGRTYRYRVSETFLADFNDSWVMGQVRGRDMLTLQTCTPISTFEKRLIVRADRIEDTAIG